MRLRSLFGCLLLAFASLVAAQDSTFQYTGTLSDAQQPAPTGSFDFQVGLYDGAGAGAALLAPVQVLPAVPVQSGYFTLSLDFGSAVLAPQAWLQIGVRPAGVGGFDTLSPRQKLGHVPLSYFAEITDWSGIANVPGPLAQLAARPAGIGNVVVNALGDLASLRVRAIEFGVARDCLPTCGVPVFEDVELLVEPNKDWWKFYKWVHTGEGGGSLPDDISAAIHLDATGGLGANPIVTLQGAEVTRVKYESGTGAGGTDLVRLGLHYVKLTLTVGATGVTYTYDRSLLQGSAVPASCPDFFSAMAAGVPVTGAPGSTLFLPAPPNPIDVSRPFDDPSANFTAPLLRFPLDPAAPNRWARAATCALALATTNTALAPAPTLTYNSAANTKPDDYFQRITWKNAKMVGMRLESDAQGALTTDFSIFGECIGLSVNQGAAGVFQTFGWSYAGNTTCTP